MGQDEAGTLARIKNLHSRVVEPHVAGHGGRIFKTMGDGFLVEFPSPLEAVECAVAIQEALKGKGTQEPSQVLRLRIGINLGDIIIENDGDVFGDGVNVAARLEQIADPGGILISSKVHEEVRGKVPYRFNEKGEQQFKNIERSVQVYALDEESPAPARGQTSGLPLPEKPSIAVLPFANLSNDRDQDFFSDGIVEEIIAALSRFRTLFVIARNSTFAYRGAAKDVRHIARELGVRYILEGSVRRSGRRVRVATELIDGADGSHIWADRFDSEADDIFDLQDRLTEAIVGAIQPSIRSSEIERAKRKRPDSLDAYDCVMRAMPTVWSHDPELALQALEHLERAMSLDPNYALAKSLASWCHAQQVIYLRSSDPSRDRELALTLAEQAARLDSNDPLVLTTLSAAYTLSGRLDRAATLIERALQLDPNSAWAWQRSGWIHVYKAQPELALDHFGRGLRISPFDPINFNSYIGTGMAHFAAGRYEDAIEWIEKGILERPSAIWAHRLLAPAYAQAGRLADARRSATRLLKSYPDFTIARHYQNFVSHSPYMNRIIEGLRLAGIPE
jgi:adenylate cyclase